MYIPQIRQRHSDVWHMTPRPPWKVSKVMRVEFLSLRASLRGFTNSIAVECAYSAGACLVPRSRWMSVRRDANWLWRAHYAPYTLQLMRRLHRQVAIDRFHGQLLRWYIHAQHTF